MAWGSRIYDRPYGGLFGGSRGLNQARCLITRNAINITEAMSEPLILAPDEGILVSDARRLYQRIYCTNVNDRPLELSIQMNGAIYSAADPGGGLVPLADASWSLVSGTEIGVTDGTSIGTLSNTQSDFDGIDFIDLWTWVYQDSDFFSEEFQVVHELWANRYWWLRKDGIQSATKREDLPKSDRRTRLTTKEQP